MSNSAQTMLFFLAAQISALALGYGLGSNGPLFAGFGTAGVMFFGTGVVGCAVYYVKNDQ